MGEIGYFIVDYLSYLILILTVLIRYFIIMNFKFQDKIFYYCFYFLIFAILLVFIVKSVMGFYIFFEITLLPIIIIIIKWGYQPERIYSSIYIIMYIVIGSFPLLIFVLKSNNTYFINYQITSNKLDYYLVNICFLIKLPGYVFHV